MSPGGTRRSTLPRQARLRKKSDFRFRPYTRTSSRFFQIVYSRQGKGRVGISLSRKVLRRAVARNRVRRLIREAFRHLLPELERVDVHLIGLATLSDTWRTLTRADLDDLFRELASGGGKPEGGRHVEGASRVAG